ncbi:MAG: hypothetical protein IPL07_08615 [Acidimicrobiaceae bacterium]|nr:hypothetical protein [Acidimicrobiaceae bacterium]
MVVSRVVGGSVTVVGGNVTGTVVGAVDTTGTVVGAVAASSPLVAR